MLKKNVKSVSAITFENVWLFTNATVVFEFMQKEPLYANTDTGQ